MKFTARLDITSWILLLLIWVQLVFIIWSINKGFDFTDEAFSFLGYKYPGEIYKVATYYTSIFNSFFGWMNISIIKIRIIRLLLLILSSSVLWLGLIHWLNRHVKIDKTVQINLFLFILLGSFLVHANGSQSLTYNNASNFALQLIVGLYLITNGRNNKLNRKDELIFIILGVLVFALFITKFSAGIITFFLILLFLLLDKKFTRVTLVYFSLLLIGIILMGLFVFGFSLVEWFHNYFETLRLLGSLTTTSIGSRYLEDFQYTLNSKIIDNLYIILLVILMLYINQLRTNKIIEGWIVVIITGLIIYISYSRDYYLGGVKYYYIFTGLYIILIFILICVESIKTIVHLAKGKKQNHILITLSVILLILPIVGAIGTNNLLSIQIIWYSAFLFAGLFLILFHNKAKIFNSIIIVLGINATLQSLSGLVYHPYRLNQTLYEESYQLAPEITNENVLVNREIKQSIETTYQLITSKTHFQKGDPIFSFSPDYLGFIYLLGGVLPGWGWYDEKGTPYNCYNIMNTKLKSLDHMIILSPSYYQIDSVYYNCFDEMNIKFPKNYIKIGEVPYFMGALDRSFTIFVPEKLIKE